MRLCKQCAEEIDTSKQGKGRAVYCSIACRKASTREAYRTLNNVPSGISTGTKGTISELRIAVDLLQKGYEVFRALSPSCSCDLAILKDGKLLRIESRTGFYYKTSGKYMTSRGRFRADILAIVLHDKIVYEPGLP